MATTTNYGWSTPDDTALVKDGASAIRTLGSSIDTSVKALSPGTTAGDLDYYTSGTAKARIAIGTSGQVLAVNGSNLPAWTTPSGWSPNYQLLNAGGTAMTGSGTITVSGISGKNSLYIIVDGASSTTVSTLLQVILNSDTTANYQQVTAQITAAAVNSISTDYSGLWGNSIYFATLATNAAGAARMNCQIDGTGTAGLKTLNFSTWVDSYTSSVAQQGAGAYKGTSAITSVSIKSSSGNFDAGTLYVYGA
jgi:hypothetical protein